MIKKVFLDIYNRNFLICIGSTREEIEAAISEHFDGEKIEYDVTNCLGRCEHVIRDNRGDLIVMYFRHADGSLKSMGTAVHESVHAANFMYIYLGIKPDPDNDEPQAYLIDWISRQVMGAMHEYNSERQG